MTDEPTSQPRQPGAPSAEGVIDNIAGWLDGKEKLDVFALYDELACRYGPRSPTNYNARLLFDLYCMDRDAS